MIAVGSHDVNLVVASLQVGGALTIGEVAASTGLARREVQQAISAAEVAGLITRSRTRAAAWEAA